MSEDLSISSGWCRGGTACSGFFPQQIMVCCTCCNEWEGRSREKREEDEPSLREEPGALLSPSLSSALLSLPPALHHLFLPSGLRMRASVGEQLDMSCGSFQQVSILGPRFSSGIVCSFLEKGEGKNCNPNNISVLQQSFYFDG